MNFVRPAAKISVIVIIPNIVVIIWFELPLRTQLKQFFQDTLNPFCCCRNVGIESSFHYLLHCLPYLNAQTAFLDNVTRVYPNIFDQSCSTFTQIFLFRPSLSGETSTSVLNLLIDYICLIKRFEENCLSTIDARQKTCWIIFFFSYSFIWLLKCCKNRSFYYMFYISLYKVLSWLYISYFCYMFYYIFTIYLYAH